MTLGHDVGGSESGDAGRAPPAALSTADCDVVSRVRVEEKSQESKFIVYCE